MKAIAMRVTLFAAMLAVIAALPGTGALAATDPDSVELSPTSASGGLLLPGFGTLVRDFTLTFDFTPVSDTRIIEGASLFFPPDHALSTGGSATVSLFNGAGATAVEIERYTIPRIDSTGLIKLPVNDLATLKAARASNTLSLTIISDLSFIIPLSTTVNDYFMTNATMQVNYFVPAPPTVPLPGAFVLGLGSIGVLGALGLRRRRNT